MEKQTSLLLEQMQQTIFLIAKKQQLEKERYKILEQELVALKSLIQKKDQQLQELKQKNEQIQEVLSLQDPNEKTKKFQNKLDHLLKEIDHCISLIE